MRPNLLQDESTVTFPRGLLRTLAWLCSGAMGLWLGGAVVRLESQERAAPRMHVVIGTIRVHPAAALPSGETRPGPAVSGAVRAGG